MKPDVVVGGFGTSEYQVNELADTISRHLDHEVVGITFVDATRDPDATAEAIHRRHVLTHSAGFVAVKEVVDSHAQLMLASVTAVAPAHETSRRLIVSRAPKIGRNLAIESIVRPSSLVSNVRHVGYMAKEMHKNGRHHLGAIPKIAVFDSYQAAMDIAAPVRLVQMRRDELFRYPKLNPDDLALHRVEVLTVPGKHPDLISKTRGVLTAMGFVAARLDASFVERDNEYSLPLPYLHPSTG